METINKQSNKVKHRDGTTIYTKRADQGEEGRKQNWHRILSPKQQPVGDMSTKTKQHAWDEESVWDSGRHTTNTGEGTSAK